MARKRLVDAQKKKEVEAQLKKAQGEGSSVEEVIKPVIKKTTSTEKEVEIETPVQEMVNTEETLEQPQETTTPETEEDVENTNENEEFREDVMEKTPLKLEIDEPISNIIDKIINSVDTDSDNVNKFRQYLFDYYVDLLKFEDVYDGSQFNINVGYCDIIDIVKGDVFNDTQTLILSIPYLKHNLIVDDAIVVWNTEEIYSKELGASNYDKLTPFTNNKIVEIEVDDKISLMKKEIEVSLIQSNDNVHGIMGVGKDYDINSNKFFITWLEKVVEYKDPKEMFIILSKRIEELKEENNKLKKEISSIPNLRRNLSSPKFKPNMTGGKGYFNGGMYGTVD